jgi:hypothetical protein
MYYEKHLLRTVVLIKVLVDTRATGCITQQLRWYIILCYHFNCKIFHGNYYNHNMQGYVTRGMTEVILKMSSVLCDMTRCNSTLRV